MRALSALALLAALTVVGGCQKNDGAPTGGGAKDEIVLGFSQIGAEERVAHGEHELHQERRH